LQKFAVERLPQLSLHELAQTLRTLLGSLWWLSGAAISALGLIVQVLAFDHVTISVVQSIGVAGVVLLVVAGRLMFNEILRPAEVGALGLVVVSLVLIALSLASSGNTPGHRASTTLVLVASAATIATGCALLSNARLRRDHMGFVYGISSGLFYGLTGIASKAISTELHGPSLISEIGSVFSSAYPYLFAVGWILAVVSFQAGIQSSRVGVVGPLSGAISAAYTVGAGTPLFGEHLPTSASGVTFRVLGFVGIVLGSMVFGASDGTSRSTRAPAADGPVQA